jgi:hypothetical protein
MKSQVVTQENRSDATTSTMRRQESWETRLVEDMVMETHLRAVMTAAATTVDRVHNVDRRAARDVTLRKSNGAVMKKITEEPRLVEGEQATALLQVATIVVMTNLDEVQNVDARTARKVVGVVVAGTVHLDQITRGQDLQVGTKIRSDAGLNQRNSMDEEASKPSSSCSRIVQCTMDGGRRTK